jgi:CAAX protease family protein
MIGASTGQLRAAGQETGKKASGLLLFLALSYAVTWAAFISVANWAPVHTGVGYALVLFGTYAPGLIALVLTFRSEGSIGVKRLLRRTVMTDAPARLYVIAVSYIVVIELAAAGVHRLVAGAWPAFGPGPLALIPISIAFSTPFQAGEEIGWRGFALPRLADRFGLRIASLVLGIIWAMWHLPQFYIAGGDSYHQSFIVWSSQVVAMSVAFAWLYARSGGSLLLVMLMHAAINNSKDIVLSGAPVPPGVFSLDAPLIAWLSLGLMWIAAAYFLVRMPARLELRQ